jgi:hypothetical protein
MTLVHLDSARLASVTFLATLMSCAGPPMNPALSADATGTERIDHTVDDRIGGMELGSDDLAAAASQFATSLLQRRDLFSRGRPRVALGHQEFKNDSDRLHINMRLLADKFRIQLRQYARGQMAFIDRESTDMATRERELKDAGVVDSGSLPRTAAMAGVDYQLKITLADRWVGDQRGRQSSYLQINASLIDLDTREQVWEDLYETKKVGTSSAVYR